MKMRHNLSEFIISLAAMVCCCFAYSATAGAVTGDDGQEEPFVSYYKLPSNSKSKISVSKYNYSEIAKQITEGCNTDYERVRAIYQWICTNIAYDTSFRIRTADACYAARKGVCQAYNELFYQLAKGIGVRVEVIDGMSKDKTGMVEKIGHSWLFAYTSENHGIFMDPTWGSGFIEGNTFYRKDNCWAWFNIAPEWLILSHFPRDKAFQLIDPPITKQEFMAMAPVTELCLDYGINVHNIYESLRVNGNTLPRLYSKAANLVELQELPLQSSLKAGEKYFFRIRLKTDCDFSLNNGSVSVRKQDWTDEGDGVYSLVHEVREAESLTLGVKDKSKDYWNVVVDYAIGQP